MLKQTLCMVMLMGCALAQATAIYKWTDEQGRIHYSSTPPPDGEYQTLGKPAPAAPASQAQPDNELSEEPSAAVEPDESNEEPPPVEELDEASEELPPAEAPDELSEEPSPAVEPDEAVEDPSAAANPEEASAAPPPAKDSVVTTVLEQIAQNCEIAKNNLKMLENESVLVYSTDQAGERVVMDENQRRQAIASNREDIEQYCTPPIPANPNPASTAP